MERVSQWKVREWRRREAKQRDKKAITRLQWELEQAHQELSRWWHWWLAGAGQWDEQECEYVLQSLKATSAGPRAQEEGKQENWQAAPIDYSKWEHVGEEDTEDGNSSADDDEHLDPTLILHSMDDAQGVCDECSEDTGNIEDCVEDESEIQDVEIVNPNIACEIEDHIRTSPHADAALWFQKNHQQRSRLQRVMRAQWTSTCMVTTKLKDLADTLTAQVDGSRHSARVVAMIDRLKSSAPLLFINATSSSKAS